MNSPGTTDARTRRGRPTRAEQVTARRRALLDAAGTVFRRDGYLAASVDSIAEAAGLTKGAVYSQFESKADLFLTLLEERISQRATDHDTVTRQRLGRQAVPEFIRHAMAASREDPAWHLALLEFRLVAARDPELNVRYARAHEVAIHGLVRSLASLYEETGAAPPAPLEALAAATLAMEAGATLELLVANDLSPDEAEEIGGTLVARLLGFPSPDATGANGR